LHRAFSAIMSGLDEKLLEKRPPVVVQVRQPNLSLLSGSVGQAGMSSKFSSVLLIRLSLGINVILFFSKGYAYLASGSLAVLASLVDSAIDLLAQGVLMAANSASSKGQQGEEVYPAGFSRVEPIGVIICAMLMSLGSVLVVRSSGQELWDYFADEDSEGHPTVEMSPSTAALLVFVVALKAVLWLVCSRMSSEDSVSLDAIAMDNRNDVMSNSAALIACLLAHFRDSWWYADPIGAIIISIWIIWSWLQTALEQVEMLVGKSADPTFLDRIREMAETHDPVAEVDVVRAYHFGPRFLVEVELVMPENTPLKETHDCGIMLQHKIENLEECERCFVHIDYQRREHDDHDPNVDLQFKIAS